MIDPDLHPLGLHYNCEPPTCADDEVRDFDTYKEMIGDDADPAEFPDDTIDIRGRNDE